jgi:hypothetical protein
MPSPRNATFSADIRDASDVDRRLDELTNELAAEFAGQIAPAVVSSVVRDSYDTLSAHVRRTCWSYLRPWARSRLAARITPNGREPSISEILSMPASRL